MRLSYSAISTYETCPAKFKFQYQDKLPRSSSPALAFGDSLHRTLHRFHNRPVPVAPSLEELWGMLEDEWVSDGFAQESEERLYRQHAREVLSRYYRENAASYRIPAALEFSFTIEVEGVPLRGTIDRMDRIPGGGYEIIDYKTNRRLPPRAMIDRDLQLSIYALAAREVWGIEPERLTLYYLLPGERMTTTRSNEHIDDLRKRIATVAERIAAERFEPRDNPLCNWCDYQRLCPLYRHKYEKEHTPEKVGQVVDEWIHLKREDRQRWRRMEELGGTIRAFAEEHGLKRLFGTDGAISIVERVETAADPLAVRAQLEPLGLYDSVLSVDPKRLAELIDSRSLPPDVEDALVSSREEVRTTKALYLRETERARR